MERVRISARRREGTGDRRCVLHINRGKHGGKGRGKRPGDKLVDKEKEGTRRFCNKLGKKKIDE